MEERSGPGKGACSAKGRTTAEDHEEGKREMTLIHDRAHNVLDRAWEKLDHWPYDFVEQEDLAMLIYSEIEAAIAEEREACAQIVEDLIEDMTFCGALLTAAVAVIRARGKKD